MEFKTIRDIRGKRITIFGLGLQNGGVGAAQFFARNGAKVLVTDIKKEEDLLPSIKKLEGFDIEYVLGKHLPESFVETDIVIKNPAVPQSSPYLKLAREHGVAVESDITIFFRFCPAPIIGITGTKGKSTTAALTAHLLKNKGNVVLAGNIGQSVLTVLSEIRENTLVVLELSSFQLEDLSLIKKSPHIAAITNILEDHINKHGSLENYIEAKKNIFKFQTKDDILILPFDEKNVLTLASKAKSDIFLYSRKSNLSNILSDQSVYEAGVFLFEEKILFGKNAQEAGKLAELNIFGDHNVDNMLCAATIAYALNLNLKKLSIYLKNFKWLKYRLTLEKESKGILFYNDTCATNPWATLKSLQAIISKFDSAKIALILGGEDKKMDFSPLANFLKENFKGAAIIIPGSGSDKIVQSFEKLDNLRFVLNKSVDLEEAIAKSVAYLNGIGGGVLLFSPACASFNAYKNEFDRGEHFSEIIQKY